MLKSQGYVNYNISFLRFDIDGRYDYGDFHVGEKPPGNRHFIPRRAKLKAAGGKVLKVCMKKKFWLGTGTKNLLLKYRNLST